MEKKENKFYILIGGNGFIGSYFQKKLNPSNFLVIDKVESNIIDTPSNSFIKGSFQSNLELTLDNIEKITSVNTKIEIHQLAAIVGVNTVINSDDYFNEELTLSYAINDFLKRLKEIRKNINFIFYSSSEVYGNLPYQYENKPTEEDSIEHKNFLRNRYNIFKTFGEYYFKDICDQLSINYLVIRPYNVIGKGQREEFVVPKMVKDAFLNKSITIYGNGDQKRIFIDVEDFVDSVLQAIDKILDKQEFDFKVLNIANISNYSSIKKLANYISDKISYIIKENIEINYIEDKIKIGQEKRIPDTQRLYTELNIRPQKKLNEILDDYIDWYIKN